MTSVERIIEYTKIPSERSLTSKPEVLRSLPENFANRGVIEFKNVSVKYSDDGEFVLRNLNFKVNEKVCFFFHHKRPKISKKWTLFELKFCR